MHSFLVGKHLRRITAFAATLALTGCLTVNADEDDETSNNTTPVTQEETPENLAKLDPLADEDGDGLANAVEIEGWTIRIDSLGGVEAGIRDQLVTSNPFVADSDNDGLSDLLERAHSADPRVKDTDGDGLTDFEEVIRWQTSPANVDTDGDSRGFNPDPNAAPDSKLFDAAELNLQVDPGDPSGPKIPADDATSPIIADTDGDGMSDFDEVNNALRSPVLADVPEFRIVEDRDSPLDLALNVVRTSTKEKASEISSSFASGVGLGFGQSTSMTTTISAFLSIMTELMIGLEAGANLENFGAQVKASLTVEEKVGMSLSQSLEVAMSQSAKMEMEQMARTAENVTRTETLEISSGRMQIGLKLVNPGKLPFSVRNVGVNVTYHDPFTSTMVPVAVLQPVNPQDKYTLRPGEEIKVLMGKDEIPAERMLEFMRHPNSLVFTPVGYDILNAGEEEYDFILADVYNKTATIMVDFGDGRSMQRHIAAHVGRDVDGNPEGIPVAKLLDTLGVPWEAKPVEGIENRFVFELDRVRTEVYFDDAPDLQAAGLDPTGYAVSGGPGPRMNKTLWIAVVERDGVTQVTSDFFDGVVKPGDKVFITLARDNDRDGISDHEERLLGTSDRKLDSDGDGLSDFFEAREGWTVDIEGQVPRYVRSVASMDDTDGDGLTDREELELGTHPRRVDTDFDDLEDSVDLNPVHTDPTRLVDLGVSVVENGVYPDMAVYWRYQDGGARQALVLRERVVSDAPSPFDPKAITRDNELAQALSTHAAVLTSVYRGPAAGHLDRSLKSDPPMGYDMLPENQRSVVNAGEYVYHFYTPYPLANEVRMVYSGSIYRLLRPEGDVVSIFEFQPRTLEVQSVPENDSPAMLTYTITLADSTRQVYTPNLVGWKATTPQALGKGQRQALDGAVKICKLAAKDEFIEFKFEGTEHDNPGAGDPNDYLYFRQRYDWVDGQGFAQLPNRPNTVSNRQRLAFYADGPPGSFPAPGEQDMNDDTNYQVQFSYDIRFVGQATKAQLSEQNCFNYLDYKTLQ